MTKEIIESIRDGSILDLLYQTKLSQMEIINLVGEILFVATARLSEEDRAAFYEEVADNLEEE